MFDAHKLDISDELRSVIDKLKPHQVPCNVCICMCVCVCVRVCVCNRIDNRSIIVSKTNRTDTIESYRI